MSQYHKIETLYARDPENMRYVVEGEYKSEEVAALAALEWVWTEKVDGTNIRVMWNGEQVTFNGKTDNAQMYMPLLMKLQQLFDGTEMRRKFGDVFAIYDDVVMYGEGYGRKIQKVGSLYKPDENDFVLFDVKANGTWLPRAHVEHIAVELGCKVVPIVGRGPLSAAVDLVRSGLQSQWGDFPAEGLVCRPPVELQNRYGDRIIVKIKGRDIKNTENQNEPRTGDRSAGAGAVEQAGAGHSTGEASGGDGAE